jgi:hypothetical protein
MLILLFLFAAFLLVGTIIFLNLYLNDFEKQFKDFNQYINDRYKLPYDEINRSPEEGNHASG